MTKQNIGGDLDSFGEQKLTTEEAQSIVKVLTGLVELAGDDVTLEEMLEPTETMIENINHNYKLIRKVMEDAKSNNLDS